MNVFTSASAIAIVLLGLVGSNLAFAHSDRYKETNHHQEKRHYGFDNSQHSYRYPPPKHHLVTHHQYQTYRQGHQYFGRVGFFTIKPFAFSLYDRNRNHYPSEHGQLGHGNSSHRYEAQPSISHHKKYEPQRGHHNQRQQYFHRH